MINVRKIITLIILCTTCNNSWAYDFEVDGIYYNIISREEMKVEVTYAHREQSWIDYIYKCCYSGNIKIPDVVTYNDEVYKVTRIGDYAFYTDFTSTYEEYWNRLKSIRLPKYLESIGNRAFGTCRALKEISFPQTVKIVEKDAFWGCVELNKSEFANIECLCKMSFATIESNPIRYANHLYIDGQYVKDIIIPESVTTIGAYTFAGCSNITSVKIPESVTSIGSLAFKGCSGLTYADIPSSIN